MAGRRDGLVAPVPVAARPPVEPQRRIWYASRRRLAAARRNVRRNTVLLAGVAVAFGLFQLSTMGLTLPLGHDEALYLSLANPATPDLPWGPHRALGMPMLLTPVAELAAPVVVVRLYLLVLSSAGLFVAFWLWLAARDTLAVPVAAGLFAVSYPVAHIGTFIYPNYYVALCALAATALFVRCAQRRDGQLAVIGLAVALAGAAMLRPSDSLWLALPLGLVWLGLRGRRRWDVAAALVLGLLVGWLPWVFEAYGRFGGPIARLRAAAESVGGAGTHLDLSTVGLYARMWSSARMQCFATGTADPCALPEPVSPLLPLWGGVAAAAVALGLLGMARRRQALTTVTPLLAALSLGFPYLFQLQYGALRFLLPAAALLMLPVGQGLVALGLLKRPRLRLLGSGLAVVAVLGYAGTNALAASDLAGRAHRAYAGTPALVQQLRGLGVVPPCLVVGELAHTLAYELKCQSGRRPAGYELDEPRLLERARTGGDAAVVVLRAQAPAGSYLQHWRMTPVEAAGARTWFVYLPPDQPSS